jgi:hypothetical protein
MLLAHLLKLRLHVEGVIGAPYVDQLLRVLPIQVGPLGLAIWRARTAHLGALVIVQSHPGEGLSNVVFSPWFVSGLIRVLDPQDEVALVLSGKKVVVKGGPQSTNV